LKIRILVSALLVTSLLNPIAAAAELKLIDYPICEESKKAPCIESLILEDEQGKQTKAIPEGPTYKMPSEFAGLKSDPATVWQWRTPGIKHESKTELLEAKECLSYCLNSEQIILESNCYEKGLNALHIIDQNKWQEAWDNDDENDISSATAEGLLSWIDDLKKHYERRIYELENRSKVKHQTLGKAFFYDKELSKYIRYESHLDKKFEKTLTMLIKLQDLRKEPNVIQNND
jgi:hypothetical protein